MLRILVTPPNEVLELMTLDPQPVAAAGGGVEYLPAPRKRGLGSRSGG